MSVFLLIEKIPNSGRGFEPGAATPLAILECPSVMPGRRAIAARDTGTDEAGKQYLLSVRDATDTRSRFPAALTVVDTVDQLHAAACSAGGRPT